MGAIMDIRSIDNEELGMSPKEIWSNEAQERYVLAINEKHLEIFTKICKRERCPFKVIGKTTIEKNLKVEDNLLERIIYGLDDVDMTLKHKDKILAFEQTRMKNTPWIFSND